MTYDEAVLIYTSEPVRPPEVRGPAIALLSVSDLPLPADWAGRAGQREGITWREFFAPLRRSVTDGASRSGLPTHGPTVGRTATQTLVPRNPAGTGTHTTAREWMLLLGALLGAIAALIIGGLVLAFVIMVLPSELIGPALVVLAVIIIVGRMVAHRS